MALKKATKRINFSDESVNSKNFWVLSDGIDTTLFLQNPILLFNHQRPTGGDQNQVLPIGIMSELKKENGVWSGLPLFDDTDAFAMKIYEKYEAGIINMSSAGLQPMELQTDAKFLKGNVKAPCLSKSLLAEISLVDIGSNRNAVKLYKNETLVELNDSEDLVKLFLTDQIPTNNMDLKLLATLLTLSDNADINAISEAIKKQNSEMVQLRSDKKTAEDALQALKDAAETAKITALVDTAFNAKKITEADKPSYIKLATADFESTKKILDAMKPYESVQEQLKDETGETAVELKELLKLTNEELFEQGKYDRLKEISPVHFKLRYKEYFGVEPKAQA